MWRGFSTFTLEARPRRNLFRAFSKKAKDVQTSLEELSQDFGDGSNRLRSFNEPISYIRSLQTDMALPKSEFQSLGFLNVRDGNQIETFEEDSFANELVVQDSKKKRKDVAPITQVDSPPLEIKREKTVDPERRLSPGDYFRHKRKMRERYGGDLTKGQISRANDTPEEAEQPLPEETVPEKLQKSTLFRILRDRQENEDLVSLELDGKALRDPSFVHFSPDFADALEDQEVEDLLVETNRLVRYELMDKELTPQRKALDRKKQKEKDMKQRGQEYFFWPEEDITFADCDIASPLVHNLQRLNITRPSKVQYMFLQEYQFHPPFIPMSIAGEPGGGKTIAYLLPLISEYLDEITSASLFLAENNPGAELPKRRFPRCLIFAHTSELCKQIESVIQQLSRNLPISTACYTRPDEAPLFPVDWVDGAPDFVIARPRYFKEVFTPKLVSRLQHIVFDEADLMIQDNQGQYTHTRQIFHIMNQVRKSRHLSHPLSTMRKTRTLQPIFVGSTMAMKRTRTWLGDKEQLSPSQRKQRPRYPLSKQFDKTVWVRSPELHKFNPLLNMNWYYIRTNSDLQQGILRAIGAHPAQLKKCEERDAMPKFTQERTLMFCNSRMSAERVHIFLQDWGITSRYIHEKCEEEERWKSIHLFNNKQIHVLVATDMAARGLDFNAVDHVIQVDFARDPILHYNRVGRTGRAGRSGTVTNFYNHRQIRLVNVIRRGRHDYAWVMTHRPTRKKKDPMPKEIKSHEKERKALTSRIPQIGREFKYTPVFGKDKLQKKITAGDRIVEKRIRRFDKRSLTEAPHSKQRPGLSFATNDEIISDLSLDEGVIQD